MEIASCYVPPEVLEHTFGLLRLQDIRAIRQVCKVFNIAGSHFLVRSAWISFQPGDWQILESISKHPIFSKTVREIVYDATCYEERLTNPGTYLSLLDVRNRAAKGKVPKACYDMNSVLRGHRIYKERFDLQQKGLENYLDVGSEDKSLRLLDNLTLQEPSAGHRCSFSRPENYVNSLVCALDRMPAVQTLSISCRRYQLKCARHQAFSLRYQGHHLPLHQQLLEYSIEEKYDANTPAIVLHPRPFSLDHAPEKYNLNIWDHALALLDVASHATGKQPMRRCSLDILAGKWQFFDATDSMHLPKRDPVYRPISTSLTSISLKLFTLSKMSRFMEAGGNGTVLSLLSASPNLTSLTLATYPSTRRRGVVDLENLLGRHIWRSLRNVRIHGVGVPENQLSAFLLRHKHSLRYLDITYVGLLNLLEFRKPTYAQRFGIDIWGPLFGSLIDLNLDHLLVKSLWVSWDGGSNEAVRSGPWCGDNREVIQKFLQSEGGELLPSLGARVAL